MKKILFVISFLSLFFSASQALAVDTVYCGSKRDGTELYLKEGKTLSLMNFAEEGIAQTFFGERFFTDERVGIYQDDDDFNKVYVIEARIPDHNFDWDVTATVNVVDHTIDVHMIDTDSYTDEYEFTLVCDGDFSVR